MRLRRTYPGYNGKQCRKVGHNDNCVNWRILDVDGYHGEGKVTHARQGVIRRLRYLKSLDWQILGLGLLLSTQVKTAKIYFFTHFTSAKKPP
jgi:hypothetical protein